MFTFYFFAFPLERFIGTAPFLFLYFTGLVASHSCTYVKHRDKPDYASLGASGAISAVLFAYVVYFPSTTLMIMPIPVPIPAVLFAVGYVCYSYWASTRSRGRISHDAHRMSRRSAAIAYIYDLVISGSIAYQQSVDSAQREAGDHVRVVPTNSRRTTRRLVIH